MCSRALLFLFGFIGLAWSLTALPSFTLTTSGRDIVARIIADERFKPGVLAGVLERMKADPRPLMLQPEFSQGEALVMLRSAEEAMQRKSSGEADREVEAAERKVRATLARTPSDSFLWLMLYSIATTRNGFDANNIIYLEQSYASGPNEGWIALRRNRVALAIFSGLNETSRAIVVSEFAELVDSELIEDAAANLMGVGWAHRQRLLASLERVDIANRRSLAKRLSIEGLKPTILGIETDERPWR
ncbi:hypothetical protein [Bradyrhizobium sp. UFLA05-112]